MDTLISLRVFRDVVEHGSFSAAAARMGISPAMASKHVAQLERQLRARLLNRSSRHVSLTEAGSVYFEHCRNALDTLDGAAAALSEGHDEPSGNLKVTAPVWCANAWFARHLAAYRSRCPQVVLDFYLTNEKVDLAQGAFDLALRVTNEPSANLIVRPICAVPFVAVTTPALLKSHRRQQRPGTGKPATLGELEEIDAIVASYLPPSQQRSFPIAGAGGKTSLSVNIVMKSDNTNLTHECVLAGLGAAFLPQWLVAADLADGRLVPVMPQAEPFEVTLHAAYTNRMYLTPKVRSFIDYLAATLG
jgi:DNA-binding transcriptional LysR family regulator